jgi:hypothetical protein
MPENIKFKFVIKILEDREETELDENLKNFLKIVEEHANMEIWIISNQKNGVAKKLEEQFEQFKYFYIIASFLFFSIKHLILIIKFFLWNLDS